MICFSAHCSSFHLLDAVITWDHYFICCISYPCVYHIIFNLLQDAMQYLHSPGPHIEQ